MEKNLDLVAPAGGDTHVFRSRNTAQTDRTGREAEDPVGVILPNL